MRGLRAVLRLCAVLVLVAFHAALFWERMADASILEPVILLKYVLALALLGVASSYKRWVPDALQGRRLALVFWLAVLLMHLVVPFGAGARSIDEEIVAIVEAGLTLPLALVVFAAIASYEPHARAFAHAIASGAARILAGVLSALPSRAPPHAA